MLMAGAVKGLVWWFSSQSADNISLVTDEHVPLLNVKVFFITSWYFLSLMSMCPYLMWRLSSQSADHWWTLHVPLLNVKVSSQSADHWWSDEHYMCPYLMWRFLHNQLITDLMEWWTLHVHLLNVKVSSQSATHCCSALASEANMAATVGFVYVAQWLWQSGWLLAVWLATGWSCSCDWHRDILEASVHVSGWLWSGEKTTRKVYGWLCLKYSCWLCWIAVASCMVWRAWCMTSPLTLMTVSSLER